MDSFIAHADGFDTFLGKVNENIINPAIQFSFIIATVVFLYGVLQFIRNTKDPKEREKGKDHIMWGIVGFLIMFGVYSIINILMNTFGFAGNGTQIDNQKQQFNPPCVQDIKIDGTNQGSFLPCRK